MSSYSHFPIAHYKDNTLYIVLKEKLSTCNVNNDYISGVITDCLCSGQGYFVRGGVLAAQVCNCIHDLL